MKSLKLLFVFFILTTLQSCKDDATTPNCGCDSKMTPLEDFAGFGTGNLQPVNPGSGVYTGQISGVRSNPPYSIGDFYRIIFEYPSGVTNVPPGTPIDNYNRRYFLIVCNDEIINSDLKNYLLTSGKSSTVNFSGGASHFCLGKFYPHSPPVIFPLRLTKLEEVLINN